jgi:hypothetical protein
MRKSRRDLLEAAKLFVLGGFLLTLIFLIPDAGSPEHKSFFAVAFQSSWRHFFDWQSAWCSVKIVLLAVGIIIFLDAMLCLLMETEFYEVGAAIAISAFAPLLLCLFGFYEFVKAVL